MDDKPDKIHTLHKDECVPCTPDSPHWMPGNSPLSHMPCWICCKDPRSQRDELLWNDECETYFHESCLDQRSLDALLNRKSTQNNETFTPVKQKLSLASTV